MTTQTYLWNRRKKSKRVHITGTNDKSLCQIENSRTRLNGRGSQIPDGRELCENCKSLWTAGVTVARPHKPKWRLWKKLSTIPRSGKTKFSPTLIPEKTEPHLSVLLGGAIDDSPPWNESPNDDGWRGPRP